MLCEALDSPDAEQWKQAIKKEVQGHGYLHSD